MTTTSVSNDKIACKICGAEVHSIEIHLNKEHPTYEGGLAAYQAEYPGAPVLSELAKVKLEEMRRKRAAEAAAAGGAATGEPAAAAATTGEAAEDTTVATAAAGRAPLHSTFELGKTKAALSAAGTPIMIRVFERATLEHAELVPDIDPNYVYDVDALKNILIGVELNIPTYVWGHTGCGKTTILEQIMARTNRPWLRVQHTVNTEEAHIVGQWTVKDGQTVFELGPLAMAMKHGWVYCADEYDFALPSVLSVYQPILEGKALVIKEADAANRVIKPHPNFRFVATGNTNGTGDETGLYQGTQLQNAANYDRFGVVVQMTYMAKKAEQKILEGQAGLAEEDAQKMVEFASLVRDAYGAKRVTTTISPRTLINAGRIGLLRGSFRAGLTVSFLNKLTSLDREVVDGLAQRIFG